MTTQPAGQEKKHLLPYNLSPHTWCESPVLSHQPDSCGRATGTHLCHIQPFHVLTHLGGG